MDRRVALKSLALLAGGTAMASCGWRASETKLPLRNLSVTTDQETLLIDVMDTLIPKSEIPGAKELKVHQFVLKMVDDCYPKVTQERFQKGLDAFDKWAKDTSGKSFEKNSPEEKMILLSQLEQLKPATDGEQGLPVRDFYLITRSHTIQGFLSSEYIMTNVLPYTMIPGRFDGCIEIKDLSDIKTILG